MGSAATLHAEIRTEVIDYTVEGEQFTGYLAYDDSISGERPGVLVVHEWWGHNDFARDRAEALAREGYTAFALDMYGTGRQADHPDDAQQFMQAVMSDMDVAEARFRAAMEVLQNHETVDPNRIAAQGYCFGGAVVLHMARRGVDLAGVVSLHGALGGGEPPEPGTITARIQVYTGGADPMVPPSQVAGFVEEMQTAGADFSLVSYPDVLHSFTSPAADDYAEEFGMPVGYDEHADQHSWQGLTRFYEELFGTGRQ
ncbi:dienelactone hydrolase family protein [Natronocella acetinitrilica]|nr:dienelactone hydrolase family protein [Natronocella acetinitrilica]